MFCFYAPSGDGLAATVAAALEPLPDYPPQSRSRTDAEWSHYFEELYPDAESRNLIQGMETMGALARAGDRHELPRAVQHRVHFPDEATRSEFVEELRAQGFETITHAHETSALPYGVQFERVHAIVWKELHATTLGLLLAARALGGEYDGWETSVERGTD